MEKKKIMFGILSIMRGADISIDEMKNFIDETKKEKFKLVKEPNPNFIFEVDEVFHITGRGLVVSGKVIKGALKKGDSLMLVPLKNIPQFRIGTDDKVNNKHCRCIDVEKFRKIVEDCKEGDVCALLLKGISKEDVHRGDWLVDEGLVLEKERSNFSEGEKLKRAKS